MGFVLFSFFFKYKNLKGMIDVTILQCKRHKDQYLNNITKENTTYIYIFTNRSTQYLDKT